MRTVINSAQRFASVSTHIPPAIVADRSRPESVSLAALIGIAAIHGGALLGLMRFAPTHPAMLTPAAISMQVEMVSLAPPAPAAKTHTAATIAPSASIKQETRPRIRRPVASLVAPSAKASETIAPPSDPEAAEAPAATAQDHPAAAEASATAAPAATEITQARFDANYLKNPAPAYPAMSRRLGEEGRVVLRVFVDVEGRPEQIELKNSSGFPRLDQAAEDAVRRWKFAPARRGDEAVATWVAVPIVFNLHS